MRPRWRGTDGLRGVGGKLKTGGSLRVDVGASTLGVPPALVWVPEAAFSNPRFTFKAESFAEARAGIGIGVKAGLGNDYVASATLKLGASTELSARPGGCSWDARFGQFSAGGKLLGWDIETPKTPGVLHQEPVARPVLVLPAHAEHPVGDARAGSHAGARGPGRVPVAGTGPWGRLIGQHFSALAGSSSIICGLRVEDASAVAGRGESWGLTAPPPGAYAAISGGSDHACGLRPGGRPVCWGSNGFGQLDLPFGEFASISTGGFHTCGLRADATVTCWGTITDAPPGRFAAIASGAFHTCGLRENGALTCWGTETAALTPPDGSFTAVFSSAGYSCALRADGHPVCWGESHGPYEPEDPPDVAFTSLALAQEHACGLRPDGTAICWADPVHGRNDPPAGAFTQIAISFYGGCGLRASGATECWGSQPV